MGGRDWPELPAREAMEGDATDGDPYSSDTPDLDQSRERAVRSLDPDSPDSADDDVHQLMREATEVVADRYTSVEDFIPDYSLDAVPADSTTNSKFPYDAMARAYVLKLISPRIGDYGLLEWLLNRRPEWASRMGFDPDEIPDRTTFSNQWWTRWREAYRSHLRYEAARAATMAKTYDLEIADGAQELIDAYLPDEENREIPEEHRLELSARDRVFNEFGDLFDELIDYGRGPNKSIPAEELTELATFTGRRNESMLGGRDVYVSEHQVTEQDYLSSETLAKPIRQYSRELAERNYSRNNAIPPNERAFDWSVNPEDRNYGDGESWHKRTERGIEKQVEMLQSRGMLDRPVDICIDGTARDYNNRNDTDVDEPDGVLHRYPKYETGYAWEDITITAIYRGRAIVLASISKVKDDDRFQCVRYLLDRACDLVNVRNVYADSEFGTQKICSYINHVGCDYVIKKRDTPSVKGFRNEAEGRADWTDYELEGGDHSKHKTTLVALEKVSKSVTKKGQQRRKNDSDDDTQQATLPGLGDDDEESADETEDIEHAAFITSLDVQARGLHPKAPGPRRDSHTAYGVGQLYRKRWSIETAFRDIKQNFKAKPRSRCLGIRRFFFMLCLLLYNCWVLLNLIVADKSEHRDEEDIIWRKKIFVIDLHRDVFSHRVPD